MSNDNKTLADARPGGRVRLGDQAERARFEAWAKVQGYNLEWRHEGYVQRSSQIAYHAWQAALSAQPSPDRSFDLEAMLAACVPGGDIADPQVIADNIRHWFAAQPSPGGQDAPSIDYEDLLDQAKDLIHCGCSVNGAFEWLLEQLTDGEPLAARQPVGQEPAFFVNRWEMEHGTAAGLVAMRAGKHLGIRDFFTVPLYAAPPAQAVDLGQFRALAAFGEEFAFSSEKQPQSRVIYAQARRLLALLDSQAVGK
ncbi:hypothetical protein ACWWU7_08150 [Stenotrophomonas sp. SM006]